MNKIVKKIIAKQGNEIVCSPRLVNMMDDEGAFSSPDTQVNKKILREIISSGYAQKFLLIGKWNDEAKMLATEFSKKNALSNGRVSYIFHSLAFGMNWTNREPIFHTSSAQFYEKQKEEKGKSVAKEKEEEKVRQLQQKATENETRAREAELRLQETQRQLAEAVRKASKAKTTVSSAKSAKPITKEEIEEKKEKKNEYISYGLIIVSWLIWLAFVIFTVFFFSHGIGQTIASVVIAGGIAFLLAYASVFIDLIITGLENIILKILGMIFIIVLEVAIMGLGIKIVGWFD